MTTTAASISVHQCAPTTIGELIVTPGARSSAALLPAPDVTTSEDDALTALAIVMVQQKHAERLFNDRARDASAKAQEEAHERKIEKMHELADDTFSEGVVAGALEGAGAVASGISATKDFSATLSQFRHGSEASMETATLIRDAKLLRAASEGFSAASRFGGSLAKASQERDREMMAIADKDLDGAKGALDSASTASSRAQEDIRSTIAALRQLMAARSQLANAAIIRG